MTTATLGLDLLPDRCEHGFHSSQRALHDCTPVAPTSGDWPTFVAALKRAVRDDGTVHQTDMRPLIQSVPHKQRGLLYRRARTLGLIEEVGLEPSTDAAGRNSDKLQRVYKLRSAAA